MASGWVPQHNRSITLYRLANFVDDKGLFRDVSIKTTLYQRRSSACVQLEVWSVPPGQPFPRYSDAIQQTYRPTQLGESFGPLWSTHWFRVTATVPDDWVEHCPAPLHFVWDSNCEAMLYVDGHPVQSFTNERYYYTLDKSAKPGATYTFYVELAANVRQPDGIEAPDLAKTYPLVSADLALPNEAAWDLLYDFMAVADMAHHLAEDSDVGMEALFVANKMVSLYRRDDASTWPEASQLLKTFLAKTGAPNRHQVYAVGHCHIDTAWLWPFEETHRKVARSWVSQLVLFDQFPQHKFACSQAQQYSWLREDHPELFARVQAAAKAGHFAPTGGSWVEMDANVPCGESLVRQFLFGQRFFEAAFGSRCDVFWLPDTFGYAAQLPQLAHGAGMKYFLTQKLSWNNINIFPHNTFYWQALDGTRVLTHFPPANTYNSVANVEEIQMSMRNNKDKDRAPASLLLFGNGDGGGGPTEPMLRSIERLADVDGLPRIKIVPPSEFFHQLEASSHDLLTWQGELYFELHRGTYTTHAYNKACNRRCEGLLREVEMLSAAAMLLAPAGSFSYPKSELDAIWRDVLLFQFHDVLPGSSIAAVYITCVKRYSEMIPHLERLRGEALALLASGGRVPPAANSAHSGASGGAMGPCDIQGARQLVSADEMDTAGGTEASGADAPGAASGPYVFNSLPFLRRGVVSVPVGQVPAGMHVLQMSADGTSALALTCASPLCLQPLASRPSPRPVLERWEAPAAPPLPATAYAAPGGGGGRPLLGLCPEDGHSFTLGSMDSRSEMEEANACYEAPGQGGSASVEMGATHITMQNRSVRATFDLHGRLTGLYDKEQERELVPPGRLGNLFRYYEDHPTNWDAWDVEIYHLETGRDAGVGVATVHESGPLRAAIRIQARLSPTSTMTQIISLDCCSSRVDFACDIEWSEHRRFLKVEFPWLLRSDHATYETQFGAVARPTHTNTSWDWAKFEVCGHRWGDLSEADYGVALLNDCKYGYACHGDVMRLSLLRSPKAPDPTADMGRHTLRYAVYPHQGSWQSGGVVQQGLAFNAPLLVGQGVAGMLGGAAGSYLDKPLLKISRLRDANKAPVSATCLVIDAVKPAEPPVQPFTSTVGTSSPPAPDPAPVPPPTALIVRLYEPVGARGNAALTWHPSLQVGRVTKCNLLEDDLEDIPVVVREEAVGGCLRSRPCVELAFTPFTVLTLKLHLLPPPPPTGTRRVPGGAEGNGEVDMERGW